MKERRVKKHFVADGPELEPVSPGSQSKALVTTHSPDTAYTLRICCVLMHSGHGVGTAELVEIG